MDGQNSVKQDIDRLFDQLEAQERRTQRLLGTIMVVVLVVLIVMTLCPVRCSICGELGMNANMFKGVCDKCWRERIIQPKEGCNVCNEAEHKP